MERPEAAVEKLVDVREMARILNVPVSWLYERTRLGTIPCIRIGKYVRFNPPEVLAFFRKQKGGSIAGGGDTLSA